MRENKAKILIVDDEAGIRDQLTLALEDDYKIITAATADEASKLTKSEKPNLVLLDISLSPYGEDQDGLLLLPQLLEMDSALKIVMVTGNGEKENALSAVNSGAADFYIKPINLNELMIIIKRVLYLQQLEQENIRLAKNLRTRSSFPEIIGDSPKMEKVFKVVETVAQTAYTVLITGESGTGKELIAKAIHNRSERCNKPLITINCGAIPEALLESELFGHEKGAFTDAVSQKLGKFELADGGTLFLDEVGELPLSLQVKLLRFLQDQIIERIGGREQIQVDVRIIAATNRILAEEVEDKTFREDLFYRLSVIAIDLPALRERGDDILIISKYLLNRYAEENKKIGLVFTNGAISKLRIYDWPGNVRELENKIKRAVILSTTKKISAGDLGFKAGEKLHKRSLQQVREEAEIAHIETALLRNNGNISRAARDLGTSRTTLYDLMEKYKIQRGK